MARPFLPLAAASWLLCALALPAAERPVSPPAGLSGGCLAYEPVRVELTGKLDTEVYPAPPRYNEEPSTERTESVYVLTLDRPMCTADERDVTTLQVEMKKGSSGKLKRQIGRQVQIRGTLFKARTTHHHTRVVLTAESIKRS